MTGGIVSQEERYKESFSCQRNGSESAVRLFRLYGRPRRTTPGDLVYHILNRGNGRMRLFEQAGDYAAFERVLAEGCHQTPMRVVAYCLMPNHWHLVLWPRRDGAVSGFMSWVTLTHTKRWHGYRHTTGTGHVYQGRFKSFLIQQDAHFLTVCRYVERNTVRAQLAQDR